MIQVLPTRLIDGGPTQLSSVQFSRADWNSEFTRLSLWAVETTRTHHHNIVDSEVALGSSWLSFGFHIPFEISVGVFTYRNCLGDWCSGRVTSISGTRYTHDYFDTQQINCTKNDLRRRARHLIVHPSHVVRLSISSDTETRNELDLVLRQGR